MGKLTKKLTVYLDQNFISEMAKVDIKESVNPQFKNVYELLHKGFIDEKIVVPHSFFHDIETSLIPRLKERINKYCGYLGQIDLNPREHIETFQIVCAAKEFLGEKIEPIDYGFAFHENPDQRTQMFGIKINMRLERFDYKSERVITAQQLNALRKDIVSNNVNYSQQLEKELEAQSKSFLNIKKYKISWVFKNDDQKIGEFVRSEHFKRTPIIEIYSQMWAKILTDFKNRSIKSSDATDVDIISAYLPYIDVLATDSFMGTLINDLELDKRYKTYVFRSGQKSLKDFEKFLSDYLSENEPVNKPAASIFIFADEAIKRDSFNFFKKLGLQAMSCEGRNKGWIELYGFDDGNMPRYYDSRIKNSLPFFGLQDVRVIKINPKSHRLEIINLCKKKSKSDKFVLVDSYRNIPDNFVETLVSYCDLGRPKILDYTIFNKRI